MAKQQMTVVALIIFFAAVGMQATAQEPNVNAAAADIAPAAAAAGVDPNALIGALNGAAAGPIPEGVLKNLPPPAAGGSPTTGSSAAPAINAAAAGAVAAAAAVGSVFFY